MYRPLIGDSIAEYDLDGGRFYHKAERIIEVNSWLLMITLGDKSRLSSFKRAIKLAFGFENPHRADYIKTRCGRN
jgi:NADH:ubiquinone oxidoreductase subunit D